MRKSFVLGCLLATVACHGLSRSTEPLVSSPSSAPSAVKTPAADATPTHAAANRAASVLSPAAPVAMTEGPDKALIDGLLANSVAGYSVAEKTAVYAIIVSQEGTGSGLSITFDRNGKLEEVKIYEPSEDGEPELKDKAIASKRREIGQRLAGKGYVALAPIDWPARGWDPSVGVLPQPEPAREVALPGTIGKLRWSALTLSLVGEGGKVTVVRKLKVRKPHRLIPTYVYAATGQPVVLVKFQWLPGQAYAEGYNSYDTIEAVELPTGR